MSDKTAPAGGTPAPDKAPHADRGAPLTWEDRLRLVRDLQAEALSHADPRVANLGVMSGDMTLFAYRLREAMERCLGDTPTASEGRRRFLQDADLYLKFVRQVDRLTQIERQLTEAQMD
jgi:hypothetical protein